MKTLTKILTIASVVAIGLSSGAVYAGETSQRERYAHEEKSRYNNDIETRYEHKKVNKKKSAQKKAVKKPVKADHKEQNRYNK